MGFTKIEKRWWRLVCLITLLSWIKKKKGGDVYTKLDQFVNIFNWVPVRLLLTDKVWYEMLWVLTNEYLGEEMVSVVLDKDLVMRKRMEKLTSWAKNFKK